MSAPAPHRVTLGARLRAMQKQQLALIALLPLLIVVWIPVVSGKRTAPPPPAGAAAASPPSAAPPAAAPAPAAETAAPTIDPATSTAALLARLRTLAAPYTPRWTPAAGEPFRSAPPPAAVVVATAAEPELAPSAIVLSAGAAPLAIVQGRTCGVGDSVGGRTIVAIEERRVVYRAGDATFAVAMPAPTLGARK